MKSILLHIWDDAGRENRLRAAIDVARARGAHLTCLQITPYTAYVASDIFGGVFVMADVMEKVRRQEDDLRAATEASLREAGIPWSYMHQDGEVSQTIIAESRLADLVLLGRTLLNDADHDRTHSFVGDFVLHARTPVLALPQQAGGFDASGRALVAWNGSVEAANALRAAVPLLRGAGGVDLMTVGEGTAFPTEDAAEYLARHGIRPDVRVLRPGDRDSDVADTLLRAIEEHRPAFVVQGAYGHSRAREYMFGGVTRRMMDACPVPLFMTH